MSDSGVTATDRATVIDPVAPPFVGRPIIYYSFLDALPNLSEYSVFTNSLTYFGIDGDAGTPYYSSFNDPENAAGKARAIEIFNILGSMLNVEFRESGGTEVPDIRFGGISDQSLAKAGGVNFRNGSTNDIYLDRNNVGFGLGDFGYQTLIHEIGHALGLKHTDKGAPVLSGSVDTQQISVMSYRLAPPMSPLYGLSGFAITPLLLDLAALQQIYGSKSGASQEGSNTYSFLQTTINASNTPYTIYQTQRKIIWDTGGIDTFDASTYARQVAIDLQAGHLSSIGGTNNIAISFDSAIDNAKGGSGNDTLIGNDLANKLEGGRGSDVLQGGLGDDTYRFVNVGLAGWGADRITDSDGQGRIVVANSEVVEGVALTGGKNISPVFKRAWISDDKKFQYQFVPSPLTPEATPGTGTGTLIIHRAGLLPDQEAIIVNNWSQGQLGITLGSEPALPVTPSQIKILVGDTVPANTITTSEGEVIYTGTATMGAAGNSDVMTAFGLPLSIQRVEMYGLGGNDALIASGEQNLLDGGAGDDLIFGGLGLNTLIGGDGNDIILTHFEGGISSRRGPNDAWTAPSGAVTVLAEGATWGVYKDANGQMHVSTTNESYDPQAQPGELGYGRSTEVDYYSYPVGTNPLAAAEQSWVTETDAGAGNDIVLGGIATDIIDLGEGDDVAFGNLGHDDIRGGGGADRLYGDVGIFGISASLSYYALGDDLLDGGAGADFLVGGLGADMLYGGDDDDLIFGDYVSVETAQATADDWLLGTEPVEIQNVYYDYADYLDGGAGADTLLAGGGDDTLLGGTGNDVLRAEQGDDFLDGGADNDTLFAGQGNDRLFGGEGDDFLNAGFGDDLMNGGAGDDVYMFYSGQGAKVLADSSGSDTLRLGSWFSLSGFSLGLGSLKIVSPEGDELHIEGFDPDNPYGSEVVEYFELASGQVLTYSQLLAALPMNIAGTEGDDNLRGTALADTITGAAGDDVIDGRVGNDWIDGGDGADTLIGGTGDDTFVLDQAGDVVVELEGEGNDTVVAAFDYTLDSPYLENLKLTGTAVAGFGNANDNRLTGNDQDNILDGGQGADLMSGGLGNDLFIVDNAGDVVVDEETILSNGVFTSGGQDEVRSSVSFTLGSEIEQLTLVGDSAIDGHGNVGRNRIEGNAADNVLTGYGANSVLDYLNRSPFVIVGDTEYMPGLSDDEERLFDHMYHSAFFNDSANAPVIDGVLTVNMFSGQGDSLYGGDGNDQLWGDINNDFLDGGAGDDLLVGFWGGDTLNGGAGNDTYVIDDSAQYWERTAVRPDGSTLSFLYRNSDSDTVIEGLDGGVDTVLSLSDYVLGDNLENLTLVDGFASGPRSGDLTQDLLFGRNYSRGDGQHAVGNAADNIITGNRLDNVLEGGDGNDQLFGRGGNDRLIGGAGADAMQGGTGDDTYVVADVQDQVEETDVGPGGGIDMVETHLDNYVLSANVENLLLTGTQSLTGTGNALDNHLQANDAGNLLSGLDGDDILLGGAGADVLEGGNGNDSLDGGAGVDAMLGGAGDDHYFVDETTDQAIESAGIGHDTVEATASFSLGAHVEDLVLHDADATGHLAGRGNDLDNRITGGVGANTLEGLAGNDILDGRQGADTMSGGEGNDVYFADRPDDVIIEQAAQGQDKVIASSSYSLAANVEDLTLVHDETTLEQFLYSEAYENTGTGNDLANAIEGTVRANTLSGRGGNDAIDGKSGSDVIDGGEGDDLLFGGDDAIYSYQEIADIFYGGAIRNVQRLGPNSDRMSGGAGNDTMDGGSGDDVLLGGDGNDVMAGGSDGLVAVSDPVLDYYGGSGGSTEMITEFLTNNDTLDGGAGDDTLDGGSGDDFLQGGSGADVLYGGDDGPLNTTNNDVLDGGTGIDMLAGGTGNDTYYVDGIGTPNPQGQEVALNLCDSSTRFGMDAAPQYTWAADTVVEQAGEGFDTVHASASVVLDNVERVILSANAPILDMDAKTGAGSQELIGNAGANVLDGGAGADTMVGGAGSDTYVVDDAADQVIEQGVGGFDMVRTLLNDYVLGENLEAMVLEGEADISGSGNAADNVIVGNAGDNTLNGGQGDDTIAGWRGDDLLRGGEGFDTYVVSRGDGNDVVEDSQGSGRLRFSGDIAYEDLSFHASDADLVITVGASDAGDGVQVTLRNWVGSVERVSELAFCNGEVRPLEESLLNGAPVALADWVEVQEDGPTALGSVLDNDSDPDGDAVHVVDHGTRGGLYGALDLQANGDYRYTLANDDQAIQALAEGETLTESFSYIIADEASQESQAEITVEIVGTNDAPVVVGELFTVGEDGVLEASGNLLDNDYDVDSGDVLEILEPQIHQGEYGNLDVGSDGAFSYALSNDSAEVQSLGAGQTAHDVFTYQVADAYGEVVEGTMIVRVEGVNDGPQALDDVAAVGEDGVLKATGNVIANDSDIDQGDTLAVADAGARAGQYGAATIGADGGYSYTLTNGSTKVQSLAAGQKVTEVFSYELVDSQGATALADLSIEITGKNDGPVAVADHASVSEDGVLTTGGNVLSNDSDIDQGDTLAVAAAGARTGQYGTATIGANGGYTYTLSNGSTKVQSLAAGQKVTEVFSYELVDSQGATASADLSIEITGKNDGPVAVADHASVSEDGVLTATGNVLANDSDIDQGDTLAVADAGARAGQYGAATIGADGGYTYTLSNGSTKVQSLAAGQKVTEVFSYELVDSQGATASAELSIEITGKNDGPVAVADHASVSEDGVLTATGNVLANDSDIDQGDTLRVVNAGAQAGTYGNLNLAANGSYTYALNNASAQVQALNAGQHVSDTFSYTVADSQGATATTQLVVGIDGAAEAQCGLVINGTSKNDVLTGSDCADRIDGRLGADTMKGGKSDDVYIVDRFTPATECDPAQGDQVIELSGGGIDTVASSVSYVLPQYVENLMLTGSSQLSGMGNSLNNVLVGNTAASCLDGAAGNDVLAGRSAGDTLTGGTGDDKLYGEGGSDRLYGGSGNDQLWGGDGNDLIEDTEGNNLAAGGAGDDTITLGSGSDVVVAGAGNDKVVSGAGNDFVDAGGGNDTVDSGSGNDFIAAGKGDDVIVAGAGRDVIAFNRGDGKDTLKTTVSGDAKTDVVSLGAGIRYADLTLSKSGSDLVVGLGAGDQITAKDWYSSSDKRSIAAIQMVTEGGDWNPASGSLLAKSKTVVLDFTTITTQFDAARKSNPLLTTWSAAPSLNAAVIQTSNTQARGGDLAYDYATNYLTTQSFGKDMTEQAVRNQLAGLGADKAQGFTPAPVASSTPTVVDPWTALQAGTNLLLVQAPIASNPVTPIESPSADMLLFAAINASGEKPSWAVK